MGVNPYSSIGVAIVCVFAIALVSAQLTFSRDWTAGKRSSSLSFDCNQFTQICRQFIHDLKHELIKETRKKVNKHRKAQTELTLDYEDDN